MQTHQSAERHAPAGRYGPSRRRWQLGNGRYFFVAVGLAVGIAIAAVLALRHTPTVQGGVRAFTPVSAHMVRIVFDVSKPPGVTAQCVVRARGEDGAEVGRALVTIPARRDGKSLTTVTYRLATRRQAVTGEVPTCGPVDRR